MSKAESSFSNFNSILSTTSSSFLLLIISKIIQYHKVNMKDKTVIRSYIKGEFYSQQ